MVEPDPAEILDSLSLLCLPLVFALVNVPSDICLIIPLESNGSVLPPSS